ncbi:MAG: AAA family ATPase, partial [Phascolarctobacterium sp.]
MYIKELNLENFKGFDNLDIFFHPQLTVLVGVNGSGKTSILEGIAIAISTMFVNMDGLTARGIDKTKAHLKSYVIGSTKDVQPQFPVKVKASALLNQKEITWTRSLNRLNGQTTTVDAKEMIDQGIAFQKSLREGDTALKLSIIAYYGTGRLWDYHKEKPNDVFKTN